MNILLRKFNVNISYNVFGISVEVLINIGLVIKYLSYCWSLIRFVVQHLRYQLDKKAIDLVDPDGNYIPQ